MKQKSRSLVLLFLVLIVSIFLGGGVAYADDDIADLQKKNDNVTQEQVQDVQPSEQPSQSSGGSDNLISTPKAQKVIDSIAAVQDSMKMEEGLADAQKYLSKPMQNITKVVMMVVAVVFAWITICMIFDCLRIITGWELWRNGFSLGGSKGGNGQSSGSGGGFTIRLSLEKGGSSGNSQSGGGAGATTVGGYIKSHLKVFIPTLVLLGLIVTGQYMDICIMIVEYIVKGINWLWGLIKPIVDGFFG